MEEKIISSCKNYQQPNQLVYEGFSGCPNLGRMFQVRYFYVVTPFSRRITMKSNIFLCNASFLQFGFVSLQLPFVFIRNSDKNVVSVESSAHARFSVDLSNRRRWDTFSRDHQYLPEILEFKEESGQHSLFQLMIYKIDY